MGRDSANGMLMNLAIIGYDLINEPVTPDEQLVNGQQDLRDLYGRLRDAIRLIDPNHILFIEGNYYANPFLFCWIQPLMTTWCMPSTSTGMPQMWALFSIYWI